MHYVIVGNGVGGIEAALVLRRKDAEARISLVSDEHDHFYSRTALMYVFAGQMRLQDTEPYDRGLYERLRFERVRERVAGLDPTGRSLRFEARAPLAYDRLLLAVGPRARPAPWPGAAGPGRRAGRGASGRRAARARSALRGRCRDPVRPRGLGDRRRAEHGLPGRRRPPALEGRRDRGRRRAARERPRGVGGGGLRQR